MCLCVPRHTCGGWQQLLRVGCILSFYHGFLRLNLSVQVCVARVFNPWAILLALNCLYSGDYESLWDAVAVICCFVQERGNGCCRSGHHLFPLKQSCRHPEPTPPAVQWLGSVEIFNVMITCLKTWGIQTDRNRLGLKLFGLLVMQTWTSSVTF